MYQFWLRQVAHLWVSVFVSHKILYSGLMKVHLSSTNFDENKVVEHYQTNIWRLFIFIWLKWYGAILTQLYISTIQGTKNYFISIVTVRWCCNRLHNFALLNFVYRRLKKAHLTCKKFDESKVVEHCQTNIWRFCIFMSLKQRPSKWHDMVPY